MNEKNFLKQHYSYYDFSNCAFSCGAPKEGFDKGFLLKINIDKSVLSSDWSGKKTLFEIPNQLTLSIRRLSKAEEGTLTEYERAEGYFTYADERGNATFLEGKLHVSYPEKPTWEYMSIGLPIQAVDCIGREIYLLYTGVKFAWVVNGEIVNENYPVGSLCPVHGALVFDECARISYSLDMERVCKTERVEELEKNMQYYSPRGYNTWAGDVIPYYHDEVYHLIYFVDRHHHGNRFGGGGHSFAHLTTKDFIHWEDHGFLFEVEEYWQSTGTGTMFFYDGEYHFTFGWHTDRVIPTDRTAGKLLKEQLEKTGEVRAISYAEIREKGLFPNGANYATSEDGIHFTKTEKQFHFSENPSVYVTQRGLTMYGGYGGEGEWFAPHIDGPWRLVRQGFPPCEERSTMRNSSECPSFLEWNGYEYLIIGGTGFWQRKQGEEYVDMASQGYDVYDGLFVPMATKIAENRVVLAGWVTGMGWGSFIVHRELLQGENGLLGMRWLPELFPALADFSTQEREIQSGDRYSLQERESYYVECSVALEKEGKLALQFLGEANSCELRLERETALAQVNELLKGERYAKPLEPAYIAIPKHEPRYAKPSNLPSNSCNFSIARVGALEREFTLKVLIRREPKTDSVIIDGEIAGARTIVSYRGGLQVNGLQFVFEEGRVSNLKIARIEG